jgi:hypothetical protein
MLEHQGHMQALNDFMHQVDRVNYEGLSYPTVNESKYHVIPIKAFDDRIKSIILNKHLIAIGRTLDFFSMLKNDSDSMFYSGPVIVLSHDNKPLTIPRSFMYNHNQLLELMHMNDWWNRNFNSFTKREFSRINDALTKAFYAISKVSGRSVNNAEQFMNALKKVGFKQIPSVSKAIYDFHINTFSLFGIRSVGKTVKFDLDEKQYAKMKVKVKSYMDFVSKYQQFKLTNNNIESFNHFIKYPFKHDTEEAYKKSGYIADNLIKHYIEDKSKTKESVKMPNKPEESINIVGNIDINFDIPKTELIDFLDKLENMSSKDKILNMKKKDNQITISFDKE